MQGPRTKTYLILLTIGLLMSSYVQINSTPHSAASNTITVYIFLSESCPICQSYTVTLKDLHAKYHTQNVHFVGVFPNYYTKKKDVDEFRKKYSIPFDLVMDKKHALTKHFNASITPEVFVENSNQEILYSGRIDDSFYSLGKRRTVISSNDLSNALIQISAGTPVTTPKTQAVGCIIDAKE